LPPHEANAKARQFAAEALKIDEGVDQGHFTMGAINLFYDWNWAGGERELKRGIELNPNYVEGRILYVYYLLITGHTDESIAEAKRCEEINPVSPFVSSNLADMLSLARRYDESIAQYRKTLDLDPHYIGAYFSLAGTYLEKGMKEQALIEMNKGFELSGGKRDTSLEFGYLLARTGERPKALALLNRLKTEKSLTKYPDPMWMAYLSAALDERDSAFEWLEKAYADRNSSLIWNNHDPRLDPLRADPRFASLRSRVGLP
jgi:serine/threonine-protein kinase